MITNELEFIIVALDFLSLLHGSINLVSKHRSVLNTEKRDHLQHLRFRLNDESCLSCLTSLMLSVATTISKVISS